MLSKLVLVIASVVAMANSQYTPYIDPNSVPLADRGEKYMLNCILTIVLTSSFTRKLVLVSEICLSYPLYADAQYYGGIHQHLLTSKYITLEY